MKRISAAILLSTTSLFWSSAGFAQRQTAVGPGIIPLSVLPGGGGVANGVDMSGSATTGTLTVGVVGGPEMDIFASNAALTSVSPAVTTAVSSQGNIVFNSSSTVFGAIGVTQPGGPFLLNIAAGNTGTVTNFLGPVFSTTLDVTGTGKVNFNSGSINVTATNFAGDGSISLAPNTTVIGALTTTAGANTGTLSLGGGSTLNGAVGGAIGLRNITVAGGSNLAGVSATITGAVNAYSFSLGTNTLLIGGALTMPTSSPTGGIINTTLASPTVFGNIRPVGATNLGTTLQINVTVPSTAFIPVGTQFNIVKTQTGTLQSGTDGTVLSVTVKDPTNPLYTFAAVPAAGTLSGLVTITTTGIPLLIPVQPQPGTPPVVITPPGGPPIVVPPLPVALPTPPIVLPVAAVLVPILLAPTPSTDIATVVLPAVNSLNNPTQVIDAVAQLAPSPSDLAAPLVTFQTTRLFQDLLLARLEETMCDQVRSLDQETATCRAAEPHGGWWLKGFGYFGSQGAQHAYAGYDTTIGGTMIAYDTPLDPDTRVGFGLGFARSVIDGASVGAGTNDTSINTLQALVYANHESGPWFVAGNLSFGWSDYKESRNISFPGVNRNAKGTYSGQAYTALVTTGYHLQAQSFTITPLASLQYTHLDLGGYSETGAGDIGLRVNPQSYDFLESALGVKVARPFLYQRNTYVPEVHAKWFHELSNPTSINTASFMAQGSPAFTAPGFKTADDTLNIGAGVTILSCGCTGKAWALEGVYDYYWRADSYTAHQLMVKFTARF